MRPRYRFTEFDKTKVDDKTRTVSIIFSSETPVERSDKNVGTFLEVLSHASEDVDLSRLRQAAPLLLNHKTDSQIGVVESASIEAGMGRAVVRFGNSKLAEEIYQDVRDGIRRHISIGYDPTAVVSDTRDDKGNRVLRFKWAPFETSIVAVPADLNAGVGRNRAKPLGKRALKRSMTNDECVGYCAAAESALISLLDELDDGNVLAAVVNEGIASASVLQKGLSYYSEKTAAECVELCLETAAVMEKVGAAINAAAMDTDEAECAEDWCEYAAEHLLENAGGRPAAAATTQTRAVQVDNDGKTKGAQRQEQEPMNKILLSPAAAEGTVVEADVLKNERARIKEINATIDLLCKDHPLAADKFRSLGTEAIGKDMTVEAFKASLLREIPGAKPATRIDMTALGLNEREQKSYSICRALQDCLIHKRQVPEGTLEGEVHQEMVKRNIGVQAGGFWVPPDAMIARSMNRRQRMQRDLNVNTFSQGGAFVQTTILTPIIEILRNRMVTDRLGVQGMAGLEGNVAIPRQSGAATAYSLPEQATLTKSTQALDQIILSPHRVGAYNSYSRQLILQSSVDVENFMRDDLMKVIAINWDYLILQGQGGGNQPTGILNTTGIGSVTFGAAATWSKIIAFETALALGNADLGNMAYVTSPSVRGTLKATAKIGTTFPIFIWETKDWQDGSNDGEVNGYRAAATNQILANLLFFGNWEDCIHALWGGMDVIVDPFTQATDATIRVTVNTFGDVAVRHAASFAVSSDAANQ